MRMLRTHMIFVFLHLTIKFEVKYRDEKFSRPSGAVVREAGCCTKDPGFESWVRHGCQTVRPRRHQWLRSKLVDGRFQVHSSVALVDLGFYVVFSETRVNTGQDPLERPPRKAFQP